MRKERETSCASCIYYGGLTATAVRVADTRGACGVPGIRSFIRKGRSKTRGVKSERRQVRICIERLKFRVLADTLRVTVPRWRIVGGFGIARAAPCGNILYRALSGVLPQTDCAIVTLETGELSFLTRTIQLYNGIKLMKLFICSGEK